VAAGREQEHHQVSSTGRNQREGRALYYLPCALN